MDLSLIIPCYNEEGNVERFFEEAEKTFSESPIKYEYVFIDDGSTDSTAEKLKGLYNGYTERNITNLL